MGMRKEEENRREKSKRLDSALRTEVEVEEWRKRNEECMCCQVGMSNQWLRVCVKVLKLIYKTVS